MEMRNLGSTTVRMPIAGIDTAQALDERIDPALQRVVRSARESLQARHRRQRAEDAGALIQLWKSEGVYPFEGIAEDAIEVARRERFDICALGIHDIWKSFARAVSKTAALPWACSRPRSKTARQPCGIC